MEQRLGRPRQVVKVPKAGRARISSPVRAQLTTSALAKLGVPARVPVTDQAATRRTERAVVLELSRHAGGLAATDLVRRFQPKLNVQRAIHAALDRGTIEVGAGLR